MRRRRDHFMQRQAALLKVSDLAELRPASAAVRKALSELDPFALRGRALREALPLHHAHPEYRFRNQLLERLREGSGG